MPLFASRPIWRARQPLLEWAEHHSAVQLAEAMRRIDEARIAVNQWLTSCDFVLLPTTPQPTFACSSPVPINQVDLSCLANCAGVPAVSLPLPFAPGQLPCGMQLMGAYASDRALIRAAEQLHQALRD